MILIYACDSCHYLFACEGTPDRCEDCGKETIRPALQDEIQEFMANRHTELLCYAQYNSGSEALPVPRTRIAIHGEHTKLVDETGPDGCLKFLDSLEPGFYHADIIEVPVGFTYDGGGTNFKLMEGATTTLHFLLSEK